MRWMTHRRVPAGSRIITTAHRINQGSIPDLNPPGPPSDFYFVQADDSETAVGRIIELVQTRIPKRFGLDPIRDIQVHPMNRGGAGAPMPPSSRATCSALPYLAISSGVGSTSSLLGWTTTCLLPLRMSTGPPITFFDTVRGTVCQPWSIISTTLAAWPRETIKRSLYIGLLSLRSASAEIRTRS
jgi:hypothetical protein